MGVELHDKHSYWPFKQVMLHLFWGLPQAQKEYKDLKALCIGDTEKKIKKKDPFRTRWASNPGILDLWLYKEVTMPLGEFLGDFCLFSAEHEVAWEGLSVGSPLTLATLPAGHEPANCLSYLLAAFKNCSTSHNLH